MIKINKDLLPIKAHYFLYNAGTGPLVIFLPLIAKQLGFSGIFVGLIYCILPISGFVAKPLFGGLADRFRLHKIFFIIFQAILALAFFSIYFIPEIQESTDITTLECDNAGAILKFCPVGGISEELHENVIKASDKIGQLNVSCNASTKLYNKLCHDGKNSDFCNLVDESNHLSSLKSTFNFGAEFNMSKEFTHISKEITQCLNIKIQNFISINNDSINTKNSISPTCGTKIQTSCNVIWSDVSTIKEIFLPANTLKENNDKLHYQFYLFLSAAIISWIGMAVTVVIADAICFDILGQDRRDDYGKQKMWGSIGFGIFGIGSGFLIDMLSGASDKKDYTCIFYGMLIAMVLDMIVSARLNKTTVDPTVEQDPSVLCEFYAIAKEKKSLVFGFWCIATGMCTGVIWNFLLWHIENLMQNNMAGLKTLQGLITGVQCFVGELPFNFLADRIITKLGHINVMSLILLAFSIRFMAYSLIENAWIFLIVEILHGPTVGLTWPVMVTYGDKLAPPGIRATIQGFIGAVFEGIGVAAGSLISGYLMDVYGGIIVFRVFSTGALVSLGIYWTFQLLLRKSKAYSL